MIAIQERFPSQFKSEKRLDLLYAQLKHYPVESLDSAFDHIVGNFKYAPTNNEIEEAVKQARGQDALNRECQYCDGSGWVVPLDAPKNEALDYKKRCTSCLNGFKGIMHLDERLEKCLWMDSIHDATWIREGYAISKDRTS